MVNILIGNRYDTDLEENQDQDANAAEDESQPDVPIRKEEEKKLKDLLLNQIGSHVIYVVGESGIGKKVSGTESIQKH